MTSRRTTRAATRRTRVAEDARGPAHRRRRHRHRRNPRLEVRVWPSSPVTSSAASLPPKASPPPKARPSRRRLGTGQRGALGEAGGAVPAGTTVFDDRVPGVARLDPALLRALRRAATDAARDGIAFVVNSGWRSPAYEEQLRREAVAKYGSEAEAARWVATGTTSRARLGRRGRHRARRVPRRGSPATARRTGSARSTPTSRGTTSCGPRPSRTGARACTPTRPTTRGCSNDWHVSAARAGTARIWSAAGPRAALVLVALVGLIGAGCGSTGQSATTGAAPAASGGTSARPVRTRRCGSPSASGSTGSRDFPDPNAKGEFVFGVDVSPAVWQKAVDACKALQPPGSLSAERSPEAADGGPQVRPLHPQERRDGLPGSRERRAPHRHDAHPLHRPERWHEPSQRRDPDVPRTPGRGGDGPVRRPRGSLAGAGVVVAAVICLVVVLSALRHTRPRTRGPHR